MKRSQQDINNELITALLQNDPMKAMFALAAGAEINPKDTYYTPLSAAILASNFEFAKHLVINSSAEVNPKGDILSPLQAAFNQNNEDMISFLFENGTFEQELIAKTILNSYQTHMCDLLFSKITDINAPLVRDNEAEKDISLLEAAIKNWRMELVTKLIDLGAKIEEQHIASAQNNPRAMQTLLEAQLETTEDKQAFLSRAIKLSSSIADKLLSEGMQVDQATLMTDLREAAVGSNHGISRILLKHGVQVDWNAPVDSEGNSLLMLLAKNNMIDSLQEHLTLKDQNGLPIFKVNQENNDGLKLIDLISEAITPLNKVTLIPLVDLLREHGSVEPKMPVAPSDVKLNTEFVHYKANEWQIKQLQSRLHTKYSSKTEKEIDEAFQKLESSLIYLEDSQKEAQDPERVTSILKHLEYYGYYMLSPHEELIVQLAADPKFYQTVLDSLDNFRSETIVNSDHNNSWNFKQELAYLFLECETIPEGIPKLIVNLGKGIGSPWANLVHLYSSIESNSANIFEPIINFDEFQADTSKLASLADKAVQSLKDSGMPLNMIQKVISAFYADMTERKEAKDYSPSTELVCGHFFKAFKEQLTEEGKNTLQIYSLDVNSLKVTIEGISSGFEYADENEYNEFYKIIKSAQNEESFEIPAPSHEDLVRQQNTHAVMDSILQTEDVVQVLSKTLISHLKYIVRLDCEFRGFTEKPSYMLNSYGDYDKNSSTYEIAVIYKGYSASTNVARPTEEYSYPSNRKLFQIEHSRVLNNTVKFLYDEATSCYGNFNQELFLNIDYAISSCINLKSPYTDKEKKYLSSTEEEVYGMKSFLISTLSDLKQEGWLVEDLDNLDANYALNQFLYTIAMRYQRGELIGNPIAHAFYNAGIDHHFPPNPDFPADVHLIGFDGF